MSLDSSQLNIVVTAVNEAAPVLAQLDTQLADTGKAAETASAKNKALGETFSKVGGLATSIGTSLTMGVTVPIVAAAGASVDMATKFQQQMTVLQTQAGLSATMVKTLTGSILDLAPQVGAGPDKLAEAMYHIASNSKGVLTAAQMMDQLRMSAEAAAISGANLDDTTYALSSAMASGINGAKSAADMMGVLNAVVGTGDMRFQDLNAAIGTGFLATARSFGVNIQSVGAALATLTDNGMHADEAATRLRMSMSLIAAPSQKAAGVMDELGLKSNQLGIDLQKPNGLNVAMQDLKDHLVKTFGSDALDQFKTYADVLKNQGQDAADTFASHMNGAGAAVSQAFGGGRSSAAILTLLGNIDRTSEGFDLITKNSAKFGDAWATQQQTAAQKFKDAWAAVQVGLINLGNILLPMITPLITKLTAALQGLVNWFEHLSPSVQKFIIFSAGLIAIIGPLLVGLGGLISFLGTIMTTFGIGLVAATLWSGGIVLAVLAVVAIAALLITHWDTVKKWFDEYWSATKTFFRSGVGEILALLFPVIGIPMEIIVHWDVIKRWFDDFWKATGLTFKDTVNIIMALLAPFIVIPIQIMNQWAPLRGFFNGLMNDVKGAINALAPGNINKTVSGLNKLLPGFASGVDNFEGGLAYVHEGEVLVNMPQGTSVIPKNKVDSMVNGQGGGNSNSGSRTSNNFYGNILLSTPQAAREFFTQLDQDTINVGKGLTPTRGY